MYIVSLEVADFRNYEQGRLGLAPGCTFLIGANGQGKTNLVEAIAYAATLRSHRVATDAPLIRRGAEAASIRVVAQRADRRASLDLQLTAGKGTRAKLNGSPLPRARDGLGLVRAVVFAPEDLALIKGDPAERRNYLDDLLVQRTPRWAGLLADVDRVLRQRGALLRGVAKRGGRPDGSDSTTLAVWDEQLAHHGGRLWAAREELLETLRDPFTDAYSSIAGAGADPLIHYRSSTGASVGGDAQEAGRILHKAIAQRHEEEFRRGVNLTGPHRDDVAIEVNGLPAKGYASQGESWSLALALRLAAYRVLTLDAVEGGDPVLILDDVFAELDTSRRERLVEQVRDAEQVIITAAVADDVPGTLQGARFAVASGEVEAWRP